MHIFGLGRERMNSNIMAIHGVCGLGGVGRRKHAIPGKAEEVDSRISALCEHEVTSKEDVPRMVAF